jgi:hypothetical protein
MAYYNFSQQLARQLPPKQWKHVKVTREVVEAATAEYLKLGGKIEILSPATIIEREEDDEIEQRLRDEAERRGPDGVRTLRTQDEE